VPVIEPRIIVDLGYQLSVAGLAALIAAGDESRAACWLGRVLNRLASGDCARSESSRTLASIVSLPLIALDVRPHEPR
jgi:hypothetical protein